MADVSLPTAHVTILGVIFFGSDADMAIGAYALEQPH